MHVQTTKVVTKIESMVLDQTMLKLCLFWKQSCLGFSGLNKNQPRLLSSLKFALNILNDGDTFRLAYMDYSVCSEICKDYGQ